LKKAVGISSVSPAAKWAKEGKMHFLLPEAHVWSVLPKKSAKKVQQARMYSLGDGGNYENGGLLALLQRGVSKVSMWVSTFIPLAPSSKRYGQVDFCALAHLKMSERSWEDLLGDAQDFLVDPTLADKFGFPYTDPGNYYTHNQVFAKMDLPPILCEMQKLKKAGKPVVHRSRHKVLPNRWWGITGGHTVHLVVVYLEQCKEFEGRLPEETRSSLGPKDTADRTWKTSGELARFPYYKTQGQTRDPLEITKLTNREVNLLAAQSEYTVLQNAAIFRDLFA